MDDLSLQLEMTLRLLLAAVLGAAIGFERELHEHPAGMRTHLLLALGSALFTVLSVAAFDLGVAPNGSIPVDPGRVAAQIVSGIGFLGAGAILKYGTTIKGLTTAANLWSTSAIGMAVGAGWIVVAIAGTLISVLSLGPLQSAIEKLRRKAGRSVWLTLSLDDLSPIAAITGEATNRRIEIDDMRTEHIPGGGYTLHLVLALPPGAVPGEVIEAFGGLDGVQAVGSARVRDADH